MNPLKIELIAREDKYKNTFYLGKLEAPVQLDFSNGVAFLIFISEAGVEELQIAPLLKVHNLSELTLKDNRYSISLEHRKDEDQAIYYLGKVKTEYKIDCTQGISFLVFVSKRGKEELQIIPFSTSSNAVVEVPEVAVFKANRKITNQ